MTIINTQEDLLRALAENPEWRAAVRAQILGDEHLQLPAKFDAFVEQVAGFIEEQKQFNAMVAGFISEQKQFNADMRAFVEEQKRFNSEMKTFVNEMKLFNAGQRDLNERLDRNLDRVTHDVGQLRGWFARLNAADFAPVIAYEMGMVFVRNLTRGELVNMAHEGIKGGLSKNSLRSFINADVMVEATQSDGSICYIAVEASYTADHRDADRALRNAGYMTQFTGLPARPCIVSVQNDRELGPDILQGNIFWYPIPDQFWEPD